MTVGDVLNVAFRLLRADLLTLTLVTGLFVVLFYLVVLATVARYGGPSASAAAALVIFPMAIGVASRVMAARYLGRPLKVGAALRATAGHFVALIVSFLMVIPLVWIGGIILFVVGMLVPLTWFWLTAPAIVVEELGPIAGMARALRLVTRRFWPRLGIVALTIIMTVPLFIMNFLNAAGTLGIGLLLGFGGILATMIATILHIGIITFFAAMMTVTYFDARIRHDGFGHPDIAQ